jgi:hypothetical protein
MGVRAAAPSLAGWTPISVDFDPVPPVVRWCFTEDVEFTDPFFEQTIDRCLQDPFRLLFWRETDIDGLAELATARPGLEPAGIIFHLSRSGSTLVGQMLAALPEALVISEPGPIDQVLRARRTCPDLSDECIADCLRWMASALGQPRRPGQRRFVLKLDAWAILQWPLIRAAFPKAACIFVYREPVEVLVSHLGHRGYHMIPGSLAPEWLGMSMREAHTLSTEEYFALVLARLCEAALDAARNGAMELVNYSRLPDAVPDTVAALFGIEAGPLERAVFTGVAGRDAKNPFIPFVADGADKTRRTTPAVRAASEAWVRSVYESLETLRLSRS